MLLTIYSDCVGNQHAKVWCSLSEMSFLCSSFCYRFI